MGINVKNIGSLTLLIFYLFIKSHATPVIVEVIEFKDQWNHKIKPHSEPLLGNGIKNHILPPPPTQEKPTEATKTLERSAKKLGDAVRSRVSCPICRLGVGLLTKEVQKGTEVEEIRKKFIGLCVAFKVESELVCTGIFDVFGPQVLPVLKVSTIGPEEICSLVLGEICGEVNNPLHEWEIPIPEIPAKPQIQETDLPKEGLPTFKVLHISDTHFDPDYVEGSSANCQEPLCCRNNSTPPEKDEIVPAGKWGSYQKCDSPKILIDNMLQNIAEEHPDIDYIIWTGDLVPHDIWNQSKETNLRIIQETVEQMYEHFPSTPIFPALGNHESIPAGNFAPPWIHDEDYSISWLYNKVADHWRKWLPATSGNTVLHGGFYSVLIRPGLRIISLNTNYCHTLSWWLLVNSTDPAQELRWLVYELHEAEDKGEKVHLIGHIAPGSYDCMKVWSRNFYSIVERFENTIMGQFYGHSHADEFQVFYDIKDESKDRRRKWRRKFLTKKDKTFKFTGRPTNIAYLGPSVTTFTDNNPAYRIYHIDGDHKNTTREVLDHETWTMNLEKANLDGGEPEWYRLYSAKNAFQMTSLRPKDWGKLVERLIKEPDLFDKFYKFYYRDSKYRPSCDNQCKLQILCDLKCAKSHYRHHLCHDLELIFGS